MTGSARAPSPRIGRGLALGLVVLLGGCANLGYYGQAAHGQLALLWQRTPVERLVDDPAQPAPLRQRLAAARAARDFASQALALPDNASYRHFVALDRPYVVWNLFATEALSLAPRQHCFPIAGCVAYRGYFRESAARAEAARLRLQGLDVQVAGVEAYSTLGWFADPLLSSMLRRDDAQLAALLFHELAHQRLYLPGDTAFSESYASFVERQGLRDWQAAQGLVPRDSPRQQAWRQWRAVLLETRAHLERLYASDLDVPAKTRAKAEAFSALRTEYRRLRSQAWGGVGHFDAWLARPLNNASLLPFALYERWVEAFAALFDACGGDWAAFHRAAEALAALPADERDARLAALQAKRPAQP